MKKIHLFKNKFNENNLADFGSLNVSHHSPLGLDPQPQQQHGEQ